MRIKLTPSFVSGAEAQPGDERTIYWDADLPGFGLQVTSAGHKSFVCQYRAGKRSRRLAIRVTLRLGEARREAKAILGRVAKGGDPLTERRRVEGAAVNTLQSICETYFKREGKKLRTIAERQKTLRRLVYPSWARSKSTISGDPTSHGCSTGSRIATAPSWPITRWLICGASSIGTQPDPTNSALRSPVAWRARSPRSELAIES